MLNLRKNLAKDALCRSPRPAIPAGIFWPKVINGNTRTMCELCSKLTIKIPERRQWLDILKLIPPKVGRGMAESAVLDNFCFRMW